ncbi:hypothetical protein [Nostoc sp. GT001]|uniref:hypothetical protein n=1 Tax=Nostoc sp. GT001 TaxID=3056647 RepID=UPI0025AAD872|nr:hypothetical protein [Nostoc sp. GT001]MDM9580111.1 hypothetical protein [Nostoc sp. GT001]
MKTKSQWLFEAPFPSKPKREYYTYADAMATPTNPWPRRLQQARQQIGSAIKYLHQSNTREFHNALVTANMYLDEAATGIRNRISPSPRLTAVQRKILSAKVATAQAKTNEANRTQATQHLKNAIVHILAARHLIGLDLIR